MYDGSPVRWKSKLHTMVAVFPNSEQLSMLQLQKHGGPFKKIEKSKSSQRSDFEPRQLSHMTVGEARVELV